MSNTILDDPEIDSLTPQEFKVWIFILCEASKARKGTICIVPSQAVRRYNISNAALSTCVKKLQSFGILENPAARRPDAGGEAASTGQNRTGHDRTEQDTCAPPIVASDSEVPPVISEFEPIKEILIARRVKEKVQRAWLDAHQDPAWIMSEIRKACSWEAGKGINKIRFDLFATKWLLRAHDSKPAKNETDWSYVFGKDAL